MSRDVTLLIRLLDGDDPAYLTWDDIDGALADAVASWQKAGFVAREPARHPRPSCPACNEGVPFSLPSGLRCNFCTSLIDPRHLSAWAFDRHAFLRWLAGQLGLRGEVRWIDDSLWQLGSGVSSKVVREYFYRRPGILSAAAKAKLAAFRNTVVLYGCKRPADGSSMSLASILQSGDPFMVVDPGSVGPRGNVRFEAQSGALWVGDVFLGEVSVGSKEFLFLRCLAEHIDQFVAYADLKREVLGLTGSADSTDEATFCQGLKSRIKKKWISAIDQLIATTNKADGYRLRGYAEL